MPAHNSESLKKFKRKLRVRVILALGLLLALNTFAWFVYSSTISASITASVRSWKIAFETENEVIQYVQFDITDLYPGMPDYNNVIKIMNYGESQAQVLFEIESVKILNDTYTSQDYTHAELLDILNDNPFTTTFNLSKTTLSPKTDWTEFLINVHWPFESNNDAADTLWGHNSYKFKKAHPGEHQIIIVIKLTAEQIN